MSDVYHELYTGKRTRLVCTHDNQLAGHGNTKNSHVIGPFWNTYKNTCVFLFLSYVLSTQILHVDYAEYKVVTLKSHSQILLVLL